MNEYWVAHGAPNPFIAANPDCSKVTVAYILGHERHGHPQSSTAGCTGTFTVPLDTGHAGAANLSAIFGASYTDGAGLNGTAEVRFTPTAPPHGG